MGNRNSDGSRPGDPNPPHRKHLRRLERIWVPGAPIFFLTVCVQDRRPLFASTTVASILTEAWRHAEIGHSWLVGRYVIMPDHVHFFASPLGDEAKTLSSFVGLWKRSTARRIRRILPEFAWQREFFDHLLRSPKSYESKWEYVRRNPVRAGLVKNAEEWPCQGEIEVFRW